MNSLMYKVIRAYTNPSVCCAGRPDRGAVRTGRAPGHIRRGLGVGGLAVIETSGNAG